MPGRRVRAVPDRGVSAADALPPAPAPGELRLTAADGHVVSAYRVRPGGNSLGAIVLLHEIFGLNAHIREVCDDYARRGFAVVAPALFDRVRPGVALGYAAEDVETGRALRLAIPLHQTLLDVQAALAAAGADGAVAAIGYCWGGSLAFLAATRLTGLACAVSYYGAQTMPFVAERPGVPMLMHFGEHDPRFPAVDRQTVRRHHPAIEMHLFPADHNFNCDHREAFHAPRAEAARALTLDFLGRHLGVGESRTFIAQP